MPCRSPLQELQAGPSAEHTVGLDACSARRGFGCCDAAVQGEAGAIVTQTPWAPAACSGAGSGWARAV